MATRKQKAELLEALLAERKKYEIQLQGYGGEVVIGRVTKGQYEFWKDREDLGEFVYDLDNEMNIPNDMKMFDSGSWYEIDDIAHENGCEFSDLCRIVVYDEDANEVWASPLSYSALEQNGVDPEGFAVDEAFPCEKDGNRWFFFGQNFEKGVFNTYEIECFGKFDPNRLSLRLIDVDGWELVTGVSYESIELDDAGGYSTVGKSSDYRVFCLDKDD
jgi:hypothetical protein